MEQRISIERLEQAVNIFGSFDENIRLLEQEFSVTVVNRDGELRVEGEAEDVALACRGLGMNKFAVQAPIAIVVSEKPYVKSAAMGARVKGNDYRSIDIGIAVAYLTAEAAAQGLATCILGWLDDKKIREVCGLDAPVRLVVTLGYAKEGDILRKKVRKDLDELASFIE